MMTAVLAVLCLYLATCYAYGGYLLANVLRGRRVGPEAEAESDVAAGPRAGVLRAADPPASPAAPAAERIAA